MSNLNQFKINILSVSIFCLLWLLPTDCFAYQYSFPAFPTYKENVQIDNLAESKIYYGLLNDFPHNYDFTLVSTSTLTFSVASFEEDKPKINYIIVKKSKRGSVTEVIRQNAKETVWIDQRDGFSGEVYVQSSSTPVTVPPGDYFIEVNSANNIGRYSLLVNEPSFTFLNPLTEMSRVYQLKMFLGKSIFSVLFSPLYMLYLAILGIVLLLSWLIYKKRKSYQHFNDSV